MYLPWFWFCVLYVMPFIVLLFVLSSHQMLDDLCVDFTCVVLHTFSSAD